MIFDPGDLRVLELLGVKAHVLHAQRRDRQGMSQLLDGMQGLIEPGFQTRRQPSLSPAAVGKPGRAVSGVAKATASAKLGVSGEPPRDGPAVNDLSKADGVGTVRSVENYRPASGLAPRVEFQSQGLRWGLGHGAIFEPNGERKSAMDDGPVAF